MAPVDNVPFITLLLSCANSPILPAYGFHQVSPSFLSPRKTLSHPSKPINPRQQGKLTASAKQKDSVQENTDSASHRWKHEPFDFSSRFGWDNFYRNGLDNDDDDGEQTGVISAKTDGDDTVALESLEYEWHSHIPHSVIVDTIAPSISAASEYYSQLHSATDKTPCRLPSILVVGCGNSAIPRILHDAFEIQVRVTCLDYSPVCIEMIQSMYGNSCPNMDFVVGDATRLKGALFGQHSVPQSAEISSEHLTNENFYDVIIDKGLLDALMCGEGFDADLERLMEGIQDVLTPQKWGIHVLVCFQLSNASKQILLQLRDELDSGCDAPENEQDLFWDFNIPVVGSDKGRACFNVARRCNEGNFYGTEQKLLTGWK